MSTSFRICRSQIGNWGNFHIISKRWGKPLKFTLYQAKKMNHRLRSNYKNENCKARKQHGGVAAPYNGCRCVWGPPEPRQVSANSRSQFPRDCPSKPQFRLGMNWTEWPVTLLSFTQFPQLLEKCLFQLHAYICCCS